MIPFTSNKKIILWNGIKAGIPIGLGYFAVSFSLGIMASVSGLNPLQSFITSLICLASAGEYAGFTVIAAAGTYMEIALITLVANARYMLMSAAYSQRIHPKLPIFHRLFMAFMLTDEIFAVSISNPGYLNPVFTYGCGLVAVPSWAIGTALGAYAGNILPSIVVSSLSVALYGMFLAVIIPQAKKDRVVLVLVIISFLFSFICSVAPLVSRLSEGSRTIILTIVISAAAALFCPHVENENLHS